MSPLANICIFALLGLLLGLLARRWPKLGSRRTVVSVFTFFAFLSWLLMIPRLREHAALLLAAGFALQTGRFDAKRAQLLKPFVVRSAQVMATFLRSGGGARPFRFCRRPRNDRSLQKAEEMKAYASRLPSAQLSERAVCDLEMLAVGAFSPLDRFMPHADFRRVLDEMRLAGGHLFPIPVTLPIERSANIKLDREIALRNANNEILAVMTVEEIYECDADETAQRVCGTRDTHHPMVAELQRTSRLNASGRLRVLQLPKHYDFGDMRLTPARTRERLEEFGRENVVAFQTRNPLHRAHEEMTKRAIEQTGGVLLLHPVVGLTKPGDVDYFSRVRTYRVLGGHYYDPGRVLLSLLPLAMRMAGPREALWHALIRRNYGANVFIDLSAAPSPGRLHLVHRIERRGQINDG